MKACICMLEVSRHGLLETELLELLANKDRLNERDNSKVSTRSKCDRKSRLSLIDSSVFCTQTYHFLSIS